MNYPLPANETARLLVLDELRLPDTVPEAAFDDLTSLAAEICETPIALISIIGEEQQWFKSRVGTDLLQTPREHAFCNHTICQTDLLVVPDTQEDTRFNKHPLVTGGPLIRFYAGAPLLTREGHAVGTLCVLDRVPRRFSPEQQRALLVLSRHVSTQLELRRKAGIRCGAGVALALANADLERRATQTNAQLLMAVKQAETAKLQISNMVERMSDGMIALDAHWRFDYVNRKAGELLALDPRAVLGKRLVEVYPKAATHPFLANCEEAVRRDQPLKCDLFYAARGIWFEARCYPSPEGVSIFFQDVTLRKAAEQQLEEARSRLEVAVRASGIGFWRWEIGTDEFYLSDELKRQLGVAEMKSDNDQDFWRSRVHPDDLGSVLEATRQRLQAGAPEAELEYRMRHEDGGYRWLLSRSRLYVDAGGRAERMLGCHIDITHRRETEEALRSSREELRALAEHLHFVREEEAGRIARELHDEMGSSLTGLKMGLGWLDRQVTRLLEGTAGVPLRARLADLNGQVDGSVESMRKICQMLRPAVLDQLGLAAAIDWQASEFQARTGVRCQVERDEPLGLEDAKSTAVFRILQELLTNVTRHARATEVSVSARCFDGAFHLTVADNGCGLPPDALARRNSFGLVGVRERALAAEGRVDFEPTPGGGTTVRLCLPLGEEGSACA